VTDHPHAELIPLAALGALDGEDAHSFKAHVAACDRCRADVAAFERVAAQIALSLDPVPPRPSLRARVLEAAVPAAASRPARPRRPLLAYAALAAALVMAVGSLLAHRQREDALQQARAAEVQAREQESRARSAESQLEALRKTVAEDRALRDLLAHPGSRVTALAGLAIAPLAHGRVIWKPDSQEAVLLTLGLAPAPPGKAYEAWVIGAGAPVPAGVFQVDTEGKAVVRLPKVEETSRAKTFAVTLEPAGGVPAPTGPMVLAGAVS